MSGKVASKIARHIHVEQGHGPLLGIMVSLQPEAITSGRIELQVSPTSCKILLHPVSEQ